MLKPCPCGKTPTALHLTDNGCKWTYASGNCCNMWDTEFRTQYAKLDSDECMVHAIEAWNAAPRADWVLEAEIGLIRRENNEL